ncbi:hypothetical protein H5410_040816 [Solanum commersonii]|uniref:Uncharacterized protein n=1 Tax=Solanum commersonii TaxID=4109 RepID=A0A9J5XTP0_SOLCO|nr:hypothetical protein H5410_040816 [Solanum commersonii]
MMAGVAGNLHEHPSDPSMNPNSTAPICNYANSLLTNRQPVPLKMNLQFRPPEIYKGKPPIFFTPQEEEELANAC